MSETGEFITEYLEILKSDNRDEEVIYKSEQKFIIHAKKFIASKNWRYAYTAFKEMGVSESVLDKAGIADDGYADLELELNKKLKPFADSQ